MEPIEKANLLKESISSALEEGIPFKIKVNHPRPWQKKEYNYTILPVKMAQLLNISKIIVDIEEIDREAFSGNYNAKGASIMAKNQLRLVEIVAITLTNPRKYPTKRFIKFLSENLTTNEVFLLLSLVLRQMDIVPFLTSIMLVANMSLVKSPQETTARGEQSVEYQNTSDLASNK